jgi:hypothetical protein
MTENEIENEIQAKNLNAPRLTPEKIDNAIALIEIVQFKSNGGKVLRWAVLTMKNGYAVTGKPSCSVSPENDNQEIGEKIAIQNARDEVWALEGYLLAEHLHS